MKFLKLAVAAVLALSGTSAYAFHEGGVAACEGCHVMHNASGGAAKTTATGSVFAPKTNAVNSYLLQGSDQSSTCLICHSGPTQSSYHVASPVTPGGAPVNYTPGGDFGWLTFNGTGSGVRKAHNVVAADFASQGFTADTLLVAPGGTFASGTGKGAFACSNCHDPHGRYRLTGNPAGPTVVNPGAAGSKPIIASGSYGQVTVGAITAPSADYAVGVYRLLAGQGYAPASNPGFPFPNNPPSAVAPSTYNAAEGSGETRVAYGMGMSEWCQNCHTNIHLDSYVTGAPGLRHPAGNGAKLQQAQYDVYNKYIATGNLGGTNRYSSLVPFEVGTNNISTAGLVSGAGSSVDPTAATPAILVAGASANVMCLSCHRAHASGFPSITRWENSTGRGLGTFLADDTKFVLSPNMVDSQMVAAYYGRTVGTAGTNIAPFQRSLCNKCHGKD
jgi:hypothetical protein